jgi:heptaprenyl diphosphate synthase
VAVLFLRLALVALLTGSLLSPAFFIGVCGGAGSLLAMCLARRLPQVSLIGISLAGAAAHNTSQLLAACLLIEQWALLYYWPYLLLLSLPAGVATGVIARSGLALLPAGQLDR